MMIINWYFVIQVSSLSSDSTALKKEMKDLQEELRAETKLRAQAEEVIKRLKTESGRCRLLPMYGREHGFQNVGLS